MYYCIIQDGNKLMVLITGLKMNKSVPEKIISGDFICMKIACAMYILKIGNLFPFQNYSIPASNIYIYMDLVSSENVFEGFHYKPFSCYVLQELMIQRLFARKYF